MLTFSDTHWSQKVYFLSPNKSCEVIIGDRVNHVISPKLRVTDGCHGRLLTQRFVKKATVRLAGLENETYTEVFIFVGGFRFIS